MNLDMRKPLRDLPQMRVESLISASVLPGGCNLSRCIAEDGAEPILYPNGGAKFLFDCIDASLRDIRPDAQDVREICDFDHVHLTLPG
jgi:hypothetical protein